MQASNVVSNPNPNDHKDRLTSLVNSLHNNEHYAGPHVWGHRYWKCLHLFSICAATKPGLFFTFIFKSLPELLPCATCRNHHMENMMQGGLAELADATVLCKKNEYERRYRCVRFVCKMRLQVSKYGGIAHEHSCAQKMRTYFVNALGIDIPYDPKPSHPIHRAIRLENEVNAAARKKLPQTKDIKKRFDRAVQRVDVEAEFLRAFESVQSQFMQTTSFVPLKVYIADLWFMLHMCVMIIDRTPSKFEAHHGVMQNMDFAIAAAADKNKNPETTTTLSAYNHYKTKMTTWFVSHVLDMIPRVHGKFVLAQHCKSVAGFGQPQQKRKLLQRMHLREGVRRMKGDRNNLISFMHHMHSKLREFYSPHGMANGTHAASTRAVVRSALCRSNVHAILQTSMSTKCDAMDGLLRKKGAYLPLSLVKHCEVASDVHNGNCQSHLSKRIDYCFRDVAHAHHVEQQVKNLLVNPYQLAEPRNTKRMSVHRRNALCIRAILGDGVQHAHAMQNLVSKIIGHQQMHTETYVVRFEQSTMVNACLKAVTNMLHGQTGNAHAYVDSTLPVFDHCSAHIRNMYMAYNPGYAKNNVQKLCDWALDAQGRLVLQKSLAFSRVVLLANRVRTDVLTLDVTKIEHSSIPYLRWLAKHACTTDAGQPREHIFQRMNANDASSTALGSIMLTSRDVVDVAHPYSIALRNMQTEFQVQNRPLQSSMMHDVCSTKNCPKKWTEYLQATELSGALPSKFVKTALMPVPHDDDYVERKLTQKALGIRHKRQIADEMNMDCYRRNDSDVTQDERVQLRSVEHLCCAQSTETLQRCGNVGVLRSMYDRQDGKNVRSQLEAQSIKLRAKVCNHHAWLRMHQDIPMHLKTVHDNSKHDVLNQQMAFQKMIAQCSTTQQTGLSMNRETVLHDFYEKEKRNRTGMNAVDDAISMNVRTGTLEHTLVCLEDMCTAMVCREIAASCMLAHNASLNLTLRESVNLLNACITNSKYNWWWEKNNTTTVLFPKNTNTIEFSALDGKVNPTIEILAQTAHAEACGLLDTILGLRYCNQPRHQSSDAKSLLWHGHPNAICTIRADQSSLALTPGDGYNSRFKSFVDQHSTFSSNLLFPQAAQRQQLNKFSGIQVNRILLMPHYKLNGVTLHCDTDPTANAWTYSRFVQTSAFAPKTHCTGVRVKAPSSDDVCALAWMAGIANPVWMRLADINVQFLHSDSMLANGAPNSSMEDENTPMYKLHRKIVVSKLGETAAHNAKLSDVALNLHDIYTFGLKDSRATYVLKNTPMLNVLH